VTVTYYGKFTIPDEGGASPAQGPTGTGRSADSDSDIRHARRTQLVTESTPGRPPRQGHSLAARACGTRPAGNLNPVTKSVTRRVPAPQAAGVRLGDSWADLSESESFEGVGSLASRPGLPGPGPSLTELRLARSDSE
jgi:hypothetical protein